MANSNHLSQAMNGMSEKTRNAVYRILDASANRAGEGLRTMEEIARFVLDDSQLISEFKNQRHGLVAVSYTHLTLPTKRIV